MMAEKASDLASSKGKKKRSYSMEFEKQVVVYAEANSNRSAASHFDVEPKRVREWRKDFEKTKSTKPNRQRLDGGRRKCIDENLEEDSVHWIYDEAPVWNDMVSNTTVEKTGSKEVPMKSTGHDKVCFSVCPTEKAMESD